MFRWARMISTGLALALTATASLAQQVSIGGTGSETPARVTETVGNRQLTFLAPPGYCILDRTNASDRRLIGDIEHAIRGTNSLHLLAAPCAELQEWRAGRQALLSNTMQVQSLVAAQASNLAGQEQAVAQQVCKEFTDIAGSIETALGDEIKRKFEGAGANGGVDAFKLIGVLRRHDTACYALARVAQRNVNGTIEVRTVVFATLVVGGKLLYVYRHSPGTHARVFDELLNGVIADAGRHLHENDGPAR